MATDSNDEDNIFERPDDPPNPSDVFDHPGNQPSAEELMSEMTEEERAFLLNAVDEYMKPFEDEAIRVNAQVQEEIARERGDR